MAELFSHSGTTSVKATRRVMSRLPGGRRGRLTPGSSELTCEGLVLDQRTLVPRQRLLEGLGEVEEAPADDDVVVERHEETHLQGERGAGNASLPGRHI